MKNSTTKKLVITALLTALTTIATLFIRIPLPLGYVNLGDAFVLLSIFILGPLFGTISAGIGSFLADLFGYITYAPGTLIIKSIMAILAYLIYVGVKKLSKINLLAEIISGIIATIFMAFGYFLYEIVFFTSASVAILNVPWNLLQGAVGVVIALLVMRILKATKLLDKLNI